MSFSVRNVSNGARLADDGSDLTVATPRVDMRTSLAGAGLPNPVLTASGCSAAGRELHAFFDVARLGAVVTKSIMLQPRAGRPTPRMAETPSGMLNAIGLQGPGIDAFLDKDLPWLLEHGARAVVSIAGSSVADRVQGCCWRGFHGGRRKVVVRGARFDHACRWCCHERCPLRLRLILHVYVPG